jgi:membrane-associated protein
MDFLARTILPFILLYKYVALFLLTFLSSLAIPIPAGTLLVASAAFASQGYFNIWILFPVAMIANMCGDILSYWIARTYGEAIFDRFRFTRRILNSKDFQLIMTRIKERPGMIIFLSRFEVMATLSVNAVCGISNVPFKRYLSYEIPGVICGVLFYGILGYVFGDSWETVNNLIGNFSIVIFIALLASLLLFWKKIMRKLSNG